MYVCTGQLSSNAERHCKTQKWPVQLFYHTLQTAATNTYVLKRDPMDPQNHLYTVSGCRRAIVKGLLQMGRKAMANQEAYDLSMKVRTDDPMMDVIEEEPEEFRFNKTVLHCLKKTEYRRNCVAHMQRKQTFYKCISCNVYLCPDCTLRFHTEKEYLFDDPQKGGKPKIHM